MGSIGSRGLRRRERDDSARICAAAGIGAGSAACDRAYQRVALACHSQSGRIFATMWHLAKTPFFQFLLLRRLAELSQETRRLFACPKRSGIVLGLSVVTIGLTTLSCMLVGNSVGADLSFATWLLVLPPVTLIQLLPISLAGWGVRE